MSVLLELRLNLRAGRRQPMIHSSPYIIEEVDAHDRWNTSISSRIDEAQLHAGEQNSAQLWQDGVVKKVHRCKGEHSEFATMARMLRNPSIANLAANPRLVAMISSCSRLWIRSEMQCQSCDIQYCREMGLAL
eukprot:6116930-Amphidinium_carterae.1